VDPLLTAYTILFTCFAITCFAGALVATLAIILEG